MRNTCTHYKNKYKIAVPLLAKLLKEKDPSMNKCLNILISSVFMLGAAHAHANNLIDSNAELLTPIINKAQKAGSVRVIVKLTMPDSKGLNVPDAFNNQINQVQNNLGVAAVTSIPAFNLAVYEVTPIQLDNLITSGYVVKIQEDIPLPPTLNESIKHIGADAIHTAQYTGQGQAIAILDTGVESWHHFYSDRLVEEACFSTTSASNFSTSLCPNGNDEQFGSGAAADCSATGINVCDHGTHVAGIAAGRNGSTRGVAPNADIVAVQVFSRFGREYEQCRGRACILSYASDQLAALEWILNNAQTRNIAAINMSIGGGHHTQACNNDMRADAVETLRARGILTVISSGNSGFSDGVGAPGCISSAITVGSTRDNSDNISGYSNSSALVDILAPGQSILSSTIRGRYIIKSGTSMAAPHVTGAIAVLKSINPNLTPNQIENTLESNSKEVTDNRNNLPFPRLDVFAASAAIKSAITLATPTALSTQVKSRNTVTLTWQPVQGAEEYFISSRYNQQSWSGFNESSTSSSYTTHNLASGNYQFKVRACRLGKCSNISNASDNIYITPPTPNTPNAPIAKVTGNKVTATWSPVNNANNYLVAIKYNDNTWTDFRYSTTRTSFSWSNLPAGARSYKIKACYDQTCSNESSSSNTVIVAPSTPSAPSATVSDNSTITVNWPAVHFANNYLISIKYNNNSWTTFRFSSNTNSITWHNLPAGARTYRVKACYDDHCSAASSTSNSTFISLATPSTPVAALSGNTITVDWPDVEGADSYVVAIKYNTNNWTDFKYSTSSSSISWSNLNSGTRKYRIKACLEGICYNASSSSNSISN